MSPEKTLILVKPDGVRRGLTGEVISRIEAKGYSIEAAFMVSKPSASITALNKDYETMIQRIVQIVDQSSTNA